MANLTIQKIKEPEKGNVPIFQKIAARFEEVRRRAFDLFEKRGYEPGCELDDWFQAEREIMGSPPVDFVEKTDGYEVQVTLPGFESKDVELAATPNEIIIHAQTKHETKKEEGTELWTEFGSNEVYRRLETLTPVDVEKATATFEKGMLRITAPKAAAAGQKAIAVQVA